MKTKQKAKSDAQRNVVSLVRVSTAKQSAEDKTGLPRQREDIELHAQGHNLHVVKEFPLEGISGTQVQNSRKFKELLTWLAKPEIEGIVFATLDRFFRPEDISTFSDVFKPIKALGGEKRFFCDLGELNPFGKGPEAAVDNMKLQIWGSMGGFESVGIGNLVRVDCRRDACDFRTGSGNI